MYIFFSVLTCCVFKQTIEKFSSFLDNDIETKAKLNNLKKKKKINRNGLTPVYFTSIFPGSFSTVRSAFHGRDIAP